MQFSFVLLKYASDINLNGCYLDGSICLYKPTGSLMLMVFQMHPRTVRVPLLLPSVEDPTATASRENFNPQLLKFLCFVFPENKLGSISTLYSRPLFFLVIDSPSTLRLYLTHKR